MPLILVSFLLSVFPNAEPLDSNSAIFTLIEAERQFARMSVADGMRDAFVENIRKDAILFVDGPINGREFWEKQKPEPQLLTWEPEYADISVGGDFGYTSGPWELKDYGPDKTPPAYGYYVSIWKRSAGQKWGVAMDFGIRIPLRADSVASVKLFREASVKSNSANEERNALKAADQASSKAFAESQNSAAYLAALHPEALFFRSGHFPMKTRREIESFLADQTPGWTWMTEEAQVATAGDLGFTYGPYQNVRDEKDRGYLIRIWKKINGTWKVVIDVARPLRPIPKND